MSREMILNKIATVEPTEKHLSAANIKELQKQLTRALKNSDNAVILVDLSRVEFIDSASIMVIASAFREAQSMGRRFSICAAGPSVRMIFELTQLDKVLEIFENRSAFELTLA